LARHIIITSNVIAGFKTAGSPRFADIRNARFSEMRFCGGLKGFFEASPTILTV